MCSGWVLPRLYEKNYASFSEEHDMAAVHVKGVADETTCKNEQLPNFHGNYSVKH